MKSDGVTPDIASNSEFRFNSGRLSLDLAATVRRRGSEPKDVLKGAGAAGRWLMVAGLFETVPMLSGPEADKLIVLREAIWAATDAAMKKNVLPAQATRVINTAASAPLAVPQLDPETYSVSVTACDPFATALAGIARDAVDLIGGSLRTQIKACAQADCQMLFVDTSPSKLRRWCSMDRCGSRAKLLAFRRKGDVEDGA